jgi:ribosome biogenesis protein Tsr3
MANADNLKRLAEEMVGAYEERVRVMSDVKQETADIKQATGRLLSDFGKAHAAMSKELKDELARFKSELDATEGERKKADQGEISERKDYIMELRDKARELIDEFDKAHGDMAQTLRAELNRFKSELDAVEGERKKTDQGEISERKDYIMELRDKARELIDEFDKAHGDMAQTLRAELARFKSEVDATEDERKKDNQGEISERKDYIMELRDKARELIDEFDKAHGDMAQTLRAELTRFKSDLDAAGDERRKIDQGETRETAEAWKGLISAMQAARGGTVVAGPVEVETAVEVKTVEEAIEEPVEEEAEEAIDEVAAAEEKIEGEDLGGRILDLIEDNPEGLKMTQIADMLDIGNWRTLIPVMRELMDDGEIRKEDTQYFLAE